MSRLGMAVNYASLNMGAAWPLLAVALGALTLLGIEAARPGSGRRQGPLVSALALIASLVLTLAGWPGSGPSMFAMITADGFTLFFWALFAALSLLVVMLSDAYATEWGEAVGSGDYYILLLIATCGLMLMVAGTNLVVIFLGLEVLSVSVYVLAGILRDRALSNEAALKYLLLGAFASAFLLYGIALIYGATGSFDLAVVARRVAEDPANAMLLAGAGLLIVGLGFKAALVPFHLWAPDVYQGAPAAVSAFMSVGPKAAALAVLARVFVGALPALSPRWAPVLWALAALSMTAGNVVALAQSDIKRMLAYSSIAHAGYALTAIVAATPRGSEALLYYLAAYAFMNLGAFGVVLLVAPGGAASDEAHTQLADYAGLGWRCPLIGVAMATFMFGLAGIPPTAGFAAKFYAFSAAIDAGYVWLAVIGVLNSLVSVYFYLRLTVLMYMSEPEAVLNPLNPPPGLGLAIFLCAAATLALGIFPGPVLSLAREAVRFLL
jgi:NADH-quinone oxidoreductase subunit N